MDISNIDIEYTEHEKKQKIIINWIKMLKMRDWLYEKDIDTFIKEAISSLDKLSDTKDEVKITNNKKVYILKFILRKITSVKDFDIMTFIENNKDNYKFIILPTGEQPTVEPMSLKIQRDILNFSNIEVFSEIFFRDDKLSNNLQPKFKLLSDEEAKQFLKEYISVKFNKNNKIIPELQIIFSDDPIVKYFNAKDGQIFKIIRPSPTAGQEIIYRQCITKRKL